MTISVTGLGYVGLPLALEFAKHYKVIGYDINKDRIKLMQNGIDPSSELPESAFKNVQIEFTSNPELLAEASLHIIGVPTDIDSNKNPNLIPIKKASSSIGKILKKGDTVVYESTVFPGCTEEIALPILEEESGLKLGEFNLGYSPERIVPGDKTRPLTKILKIVSGHNEETCDSLANIYGQIIEAGIHKASSIKVAEAAKIIENTQRDLNISLMNELAIIFDKLDIDIHEVVEAAGTKWNFHKYFPGLVGGHCIGVDPYYLIHKSRILGIEPEVIAAGRKINDSIPHFIASKLTKKLLEIGKSPLTSRILVLGVTFKENVSDIRNSKVFDLINELKSYSLTVDSIDPYADPKEVMQHYNVKLSDSPSPPYDAVILCVPHKKYVGHDQEYFNSLLSPENGILFDIKGVYSKYNFNKLHYWKL